MAQEKQPKYITIEFGGTRQDILTEKLPHYREMEEHTQMLARKAGRSEQEIKEMYTLRIVKEEQ